MKLLAVASFFVCMSMMCNAILQASGKERLPIVSTAVGGVVKIAVNWVLVGTAAINIQGAPVGSICCFAIICIVDYIFLCRALGSRLRLGRMLGRAAPFEPCDGRCGVGGIRARAHPSCAA